MIEGTLDANPNNLGETLMKRTLALALCISLTYGTAINHPVPVGSRLKRVGMTRIEPLKEKHTV
jgi:hypothetical protein